MDTIISKAQGVPVAAPALYVTKFIIYDVYDEPIQGWTDGTLWNGWSTPFFEYRDALQLVNMHNNLPPLLPNDIGRAWYDEDQDQFCFVLAGGDGEVEYYPACNRIGAGQQYRLYAIGAYSWTWEEFQQG